MMTIREKNVRLIESEFQQVLTWTTGTQNNLWIKIKIMMIKLLGMLRN